MKILMSLGDLGPTLARPGVLRENNQPEIANLVETLPILPPQAALCSAAGDKICRTSSTHR